MAAVVLCYSFKLCCGKATIVCQCLVNFNTFSSDCFAAHENHSHWHEKGESAQIKHLHRLGGASIKNTYSANKTHHEWILGNQQSDKVEKIWQGEKQRRKP